MPQQAKSPARQGWPGQGFAGSVATLPMLATLLHLLHWWASFLKNGIRKAGNLSKISCWVVPPTGGWYSVLKVRVRLARYITLFTPLVGLLSEKWHKKSRKPFTKISCWMVPPTGGWYSVLKVRVRLAR